MVDINLEDGTRLTDFQNIKATHRFYNDLFSQHVMADDHNIGDMLEQIPTLILEEENHIPIRPIEATEVFSSIWIWIRPMDRMGFLYPSIGTSGTLLSLIY
jgi:hypothetical protein